MDKFVTTVSTPFVDLAHSFAIQNWCNETFGAKNEKWRLTSNRLNWQTWHFTNEKDAMLFTLRWV